MMHLHLQHGRQQLPAILRKAVTKTRENQWPMTKTFSKKKLPSAATYTYLISSIHFIELNFILHKSISLQNICYTTSSIQDKFSQGHFFASSRTQSCSFPLCMMMYCTYKRRKSSFRPSLGKQYFNSNVNLAKCQQRNNVVMQATG